MGPWGAKSGACFALLLQGVSRDREADEMVQWTISSGERRELGRAAADTKYFSFSA
jgi:hypothetical protein